MMARFIRYWLAVVAAEDDAVGLEDGGPAGGFEGLGGLVDEEGGEATAVEDAIGGADKGAGDDACLVEEVLLDEELELGGTVAELSKAAFERGGGGAMGFAQGAADGPQLGVGGVVGIAALVAAVEHFVAHTQGVADAQDGDATERELLADPVDGGIAGGADKHLGFALEGLDDGFDEGGGLAGAGRAVDDGHLLCLDDLLNGILLAGVEPGEGESGQGAEGGLEWAYEGVAQADEALVGAAHGGGEGVEHDAVAGGVDTEAHAQETCLGMGAERLQGRTGGEGYGEGADIGLLDMALHGQFAKGAVVEEGEEGDGLAGLEIGVGLVVGDFVGEGQHQLVEGVVGTVAQGDGVAAVGLVDLGGEVGGGKGTGVCLTLVVHLHMQQLDQPLEGRNGVVIFHSAREIT